MDRSTWRSVPFFMRCRIIAAEYNDSLIPDYQENPLIEALPPIREKEQVIDMLQGYPDCQEVHRQCPPELRLHFIRKLMKSFEIIPININLEQRISSMLRLRYEARNPRLDGSDFDIHKKK